MNLYFFLIFLLSIAFTNHRSIYSIGDTLTYEDQILEFNICHSDGSHEVGETFSLSHYNGEMNGGDYKVFLISMNATW